MIQYCTENILNSNTEAIVNPVNTMGVMGKGLALAFKEIYPNNFKLYESACKNEEVIAGKMFVTIENNIFLNKTIINFPTKTVWWKSSEYKYIESGLDDLVNVINNMNIKSIAIPALGCGNGGLDWKKVKSIIKKKLDCLNIDIFIYEPK